MPVSSTHKVAIKSRDGVSSRITVFRNANPQAPVAVIMPAMGVKASFYIPLAGALVTQGLNVVTADLRGHGESGIRAGRRTDFGYREMVRYDWPCIMLQIKNLFPDSFKIILGHSLGGQISILYMAANPGEIDRLILVAAPSLYFRDWPFSNSFSPFNSLFLLFSTHVFLLVARGLGHFPGRRIGVGGNEAMRLIGDWAKIVRTGRYDMINPSVDYDALTRLLRLPVLGISFSDDGFAPRRAVDRLCAKMPCTDLTRWHIAPHDLGCAQLGHFWWVKQSEQLAKRISTWLAKDFSFYASNRS